MNFLIKMFNAIIYYCITLPKMRLLELEVKSFKRIVYAMYLDHGGDIDEQEFSQLITKDEAINVVKALNSRDMPIIHSTMYDPDFEHILVMKAPKLFIILDEVKRDALQKRKQRFYL